MLQLNDFQPEVLQTQAMKKNDLNTLKLKRKGLLKKIGKTIVEIDRLETIRGALLLDQRKPEVEENTRMIAAQLATKHDCELQVKELDARIESIAEEIFQLEKKRRIEYRNEIFKLEGEAKERFAQIKARYNQAFAEMNELSQHARILAINGSEQFENAKMGFISPLIESEPIPEETT